MEELTAGLAFSSTPGSAAFHVLTPRLRPILRLETSPGGGVELLFPIDGLARAATVTWQPGVAEDVLSAEARRRHRNPAGWVGSGGAAVRRWARDHRQVDLPDGAGLVAVIGALAFPLLAAAYRAGTRPVRDVPRWAAPALAATNPREAARVAFGPRAHRPLSRALARALAPRPGGDGASDDTAALVPVGLGRALAQVCEPDQIARIVACDDQRHPPTMWPNTHGLTAIGRLARLLGADTATGLALDALSHPDGPHRLINLAPILTEYEGRFRHQPPRRLAALEAFTAEVAPVAPPAPTEPEQPPPAPTAAGEQRPARMARPLRQQPHAAVAAVRPRSQAPNRRGFAYPDDIADLDGSQIGPYRVVMPANQTELRVWGRTLRNCLGGYGQRVAQGRVAIIGFTRDDRLVAALEIRLPARTVGQFQQGSGRSVPRAMRADVLAHLRACGALAPHRARAGSGRGR